MNKENAMGWKMFRVTFKPMGEWGHGSLDRLVAYVTASGADAALADARQLLGLSAENFQSVEIVQTTDKA